MHPSHVLAYAYRAYEGVTDKNGQPLIAHAVRVATRVKPLGEEAMMAAWLHDVVEDTEITVEHLKTRFADSVCDLVEVLTHRPHEPYTDYLDRVLDAGDVAVAIKRADVVDNLSRIYGLDDQPTRLRLYRKYTNALGYLAEGTARKGDDVC